MADTQTAPCNCINRYYCQKLQGTLAAGFHCQEDAPPVAMPTPTEPVAPLECVVCGSATGPLATIDADHAGWMCPKCYAEAWTEPVVGEARTAAEEFCSVIAPGRKSQRIHGCIRLKGHPGMHCNGRNVMWMQAKSTALPCPTEPVQTETRDAAKWQAEICQCGCSKHWHSLMSDRWVPSASGCMSGAGCGCTRFRAEVPSGDTVLPELPTREHMKQFSTALFRFDYIQWGEFKRYNTEVIAQLLDYKAKYEAARREIAELKSRLK